MKKVALLLCLISFAAWAGYASFQVKQSGNGTNGMTYTPDAGGEGVALFGVFGSQVQNTCAKVSLVTTAGVFQNATDFSWMRCQLFSPFNADGGASGAYRRCSQFDFEVDGGQSGKIIGLNSMQFGPFFIPPLQSGELISWTGENLQQATTLDAGVNVLTELIQPCP